MRNFEAGSVYERDRLEDTGRPCRFGGTASAYDEGRGCNVMRRAFVPAPLREF
jgi:hypothetical protein